MQNINRCMGNCFSLSVWKERYGGHWLAIIAPSPDGAAWIAAELSGSDVGAVSMQQYLCEAGNLFPVSLGAKTPLESLYNLDEKLSAISASQLEIWQNKLIEAFDALLDAERDYKGDDDFVSKAFRAGELLVIQ